MENVDLCHQMPDRQDIPDIKDADHGSAEKEDDHGKWRNFSTGMFFIARHGAGIQRRAFFVRRIHCSMVHLIPGLTNLRDGNRRPGRFPAIHRAGGVNLTEILFFRFHEYYSIIFSPLHEVLRCANGDFPFFLRSTPSPVSGSRPSIPAAAAYPGLFYFPTAPIVPMRPGTRI